MGHYLAIIGFATFKFMFAPFYGIAFKVSFFETYVSVFIGGLISAFIFYWPAEYFMIRAAHKRKEKHLLAQQKGLIIPQKKRTRKINKAIVKVKRKLGIWGIALYAPFFLSVPLGSIITAKFYGKDKRTFFIVLLGLAVNGFIMTCIAYSF